MSTDQESRRMILPNELRSMAENVGLTIPQAAKLMMEAADTIDRLDARNTKLRKLFTDFWTWADPPFALDSGTFDEFMAIVEQARELGLEV